MGREFPGSGSGSSRSPQLLKGALVVFETKLPVPTNLIPFQYNPEKMTRTFEKQTAEPDPRRNAGDSRHILPPAESFSMTVELDAADQLESANPIATTAGLHPILSALELLLYPPSSTLLLAKALKAAGSAVISPAEAPIVLLVWGAARVVPVYVTSVSITELAFDQKLNPIQATVELKLRSLTQKELDVAGAPFDTLAMVRQVTKEAAARLNSATSAEQVRSLLPF